MDFKSLEAVIWVDRLGSFKAAAEALRMTQPAVSARISQLEAMLDARIFYRSGKRVSLTPVGVTLVNYAERILSLREAAVATIKGHNEEHGIIRIGTMETAVHTWLPSLMCVISDKYQQVTVDLDVNVSDEIQRKILKGMLDVGFYIGATNSPMLTETHLCGCPACDTTGPCRRSTAVSSHNMRTNITCKYKPVTSISISDRPAGSRLANLLDAIRGIGLCCRCNENRR